VFRVRAGRSPPVAGARVLVVDDVVTSGATLTAAAVALRAAAAVGVVGVTAGRTPLKVRRASTDT
jgi:predicted amidophosphoribosyltransferase